MHIEDSSQTMARIGLKIAAIAILGGLVQIVVLANEFLELRLHVDNLLGGEFEFNYRDAGLFEVGKETDFGGLEEHEGAAAAVGTSCCSSDAMDIFAGIIRRIILYNPPPQFTSGICDVVSI
jgi:hypothetical protein